MVFPLVNATLTKVAPTVSADYDLAAGDGVVRWQGTLPAYLSEELVEDVEGNRVDVLLKTTIVIPAAIGRLVQATDQITYAYDGATHTRQVASVSVVAILNRARVALEPA